MFINILLIALYLTAIGCSGFIIHHHRSYYHERFQKGTVSVFMLAMLFFLAAYLFKMLIVCLIRVSEVFGFNSTEFMNWLLEGWTLAQMGTTVGLIALARLTWTGRYDQFIVLRRLDRKMEEASKDVDTRSSNK
ncbi:hypothetical protein [Paenibacillus sp. sgz500958]|uniref:hypothetical protein n=1 Tax=Paenibacillus sp. sgz500958 TaxID=3242475 RepID=UPI0036D39584